jgi:hypothetical protein
MHIQRFTLEPLAPATTFGATLHPNPYTATLRFQ